MKKTVIFLPLILLFMSAAAVENSTEATLEWTLLSAFPGRPAYDSFFSPNNTELLVLDLDGDDVPDFSFFTGGDNGVGELRIVSGANPGLSWALPCAPFSGASNTVIGFYNFDGIINASKPKEILLAEKLGNQYVNPVVLYNLDLNNGTCSVHVPDGDTVLLGSYFDGIVDDLVFYDRLKNELQVWGLR
ncbi:MAG: hypothetical protein O7G31_00215 [Calditrichaeota bacterium]|nr:hypothetical protein [Calditrichota bacterium]